MFLEHMFANIGGPDNEEGIEVDVSERQRRLLALCAIRVDNHSVDWSMIAREAQFPDGLDSLWSGIIRERSSQSDKSLQLLQAGLKDTGELFRRVDTELLAASKVDAHLITVLEESYPANLRLIPNLPPFLFIRGELKDRDTLCVAVVGTRDASEAGINTAQEMSHLLSNKGITVVSGLARGIDTAAHVSTLNNGGRTIAVLGTGITLCYPPENRMLADRIPESGALVSQFWPTRQPGRDTFPRRNVVTSGISQGTIVIEASSTSGAKMQARLALEHGKKVFLLKSLVTNQQWARNYTAKRGAIEVDSVDDIVQYLAPAERVEQVRCQRQQLSLALL